MKMHKLSRRRSGFTLVELLVVIAIIGILAVIAVANFGGIFGAANQSVGRKNAGDLHTTYTQFRVDNQRAINFGVYNATTAQFQANNHGDFALILARFVSNANNAGMFYTPGDPALVGNPAFTATSDSGDWLPNPEFADNPISFEILLGVTETSINPQVPYIWSRGIDRAAWTWDIDSPFGVSGGILVRLNGNVEFVKDSLANARPRLYQINQTNLQVSTTVTNNLTQALPPLTGVRGVVGEEAED